MQRLNTLNRVWDVNTLAWERMQQPILNAGSVTVSGTVNVGTFPDNEPFNAAQWGGTAVTGGAGTVGAGTPRVTLASDDPAVASLQALDDAADITNDVLATVYKPLAVSTYAPTRFANLGADVTLNIKASTGNVFALYCNNENASDRFVQLHNTATVPAPAATPVYTFRVPATGDVLIGTDFFTNSGASFTTGIAFAFSTTKDTYTAATAADQSTLVHYI